MVIAPTPCPGPSRSHSRARQEVRSVQPPGAVERSAPYALTVIPTVQILGVPIASLTIDQAVETALGGGLILAPSGPGLCDLEHDADYRDALLGSDLNLPDSGLVILSEALRSRRLLPRASGLGYLDALLAREELHRPQTTFWVMPSASSMQRNLAWLRTRGLAITEDDCYVAPLYPRRGPVEDDELEAILLERRPEHVVICIGSGPQEKLGLSLKRALPHRPGIHCVGAAIGFLSGDQAEIPRWADRLLLGWLIRCIDDPKTFVPRYLRAFRLVYLLVRYGSAPPPIARYAR
jgi:UDP-N-acetyl-D-mannosaminuronic acid transferase (WecB/TagA/CpsF family)